MERMSTEQTNPYSPPEADIASAGAAPSLGASDLASRGARFGGALVDGLIYMVALAPVFVGTFTAAMAQARAGGPPVAPGARPSGVEMFAAAGTLGLVSAALLLVLMGVNWYLLTKRGQTIGKIAAGTRVVLLDGSRAPFGRVVALRAWPLLIIQYVPVLARPVGTPLSFIDILFIFRKDRRCLHDLIAGTKVVSVSPPS
jgi:uncharacterized RDD family membrane protein YckC